MIIKPTTIVLGAGASMPYGMPSGAELRSIICRDRWLANQLQELFGIGAHEVSDFTNTFLMSSVASIDAFLAKRDNFTQIGKLSIATILCLREYQNAVAINDIEDNWYHHLWQSLIDGATTPAAFAQNNIRFITFNYDRSLEFFIHQAIKNTFGVSDDEALRVLSKIGILHVYGTLGEFHYKPVPGARPYSHDVSPMQIRIAADGIKIIPEARSDEKTFETARKWLYESENIGFLGFGFDALNVERLGLSDVIQSRLSNKMPAPYVIASTFGKTEKEIEKIQKSLMPHSPSSVQAVTEKNTMSMRRSNLLG